jgi:hypothetical protein
VLLAVPLAAAGAQDVAVAGRVVRDDAQHPVARHWVILHAMTRGGGAPIDSIRTDAAGRYTFTVRRVDTNAVYVVSTLYAGIAHFSEPVVLSGRLTADFGRLVVYDTASTGPPIQVSLRYLSVGSARRDGTHEVIEAVELVNAGARTRVSGDSTPVWQGALPPGVVQFQVGESDVSADAVERRGDTVAVFAPIAPGGSKQLSFAYVTPDTMRALRLALDQPTGLLLLLLEDTAAAVTGPGITALPVETLEGRRFARFRAEAVPAGALVTVALPAAGWRADRLVPWVVALVAVALAVGLAFALRRPGRVG